MGLGSWTIYVKGWINKYKLFKNIFLVCFLMKFEIFKLGLGTLREVRVQPKFIKWSYSLAWPGLTLREAGSGLPSLTLERERGSHSSWE